MLRNLLILAAALSVAATATSASLNEAMAKRNGLDSGFFSRHAEGWFWYHDPVEEEPDLVPEPLPVMPPPAPSEPKETEPPLKPFTIAWVRQALDKYKEAAWNDPTPENVKAYFLLQRFVIDRSNKFADVAQQVTVGNALLDETLRRPLANFVTYDVDKAAFAATNELLKKISQHTGLFSYGVRYINRVNPLFFFAENVSGLSSANEGKAFKLILNALNHAGKYGYTITANLYRFEEYGVPQARHRYILIGIRGDLGLTFQVPKPSGVIKTCREALLNIPAAAANQEATAQSKHVVERLSYIREGENVWQAEESGRLPEHLRLNVKGARLSQIYRRLDSSKPAYTITGSGGGGTHVYHWSENRALTNRERARLQTFPDDFAFCGSKESVRKQIGMAVPCDGAQVILDALLKTFAGESYDHVDASVGIYPAKTFSQK